MASVAGLGHAAGDLPPVTRPVAGESFTVSPLRGSVSVLLPVDGVPTTLSAAAQLPVDSIIDARAGAVTITSARDNHGKLQSATFWGGAFRVYQRHGAHPYTDIYLVGGDFSHCARSANAHAKPRAATARRRAARPSRVIRGLWGTDHHGRYRTHGANSVTTVRGTTWLTQDRCDGTLTNVTQGKVSVRDLHTHRRTTLTPHHNHLARTAG